jgi:xylulokinase
VASDDSPLLLGIDVGTTSVKAAIHDLHGTVISTASTPTITHYPRPHWAYYHADELWDLTISVVRDTVAAVTRPERIASVAVTSMGEAGVPIDASGDPTAEVIAWFDTRTQPQVRRLDETIGKDALFASSGLSLQPIFGLCKMLWLQEQKPEAFARTSRWLNVADYIAYRLSGVPATDYSLASRMLTLDLANRAWNTDLLNATGVPEDMLAPLMQSGTPLGTITPDAADQTTLPRSVTIATGGHDHVCGALATGVVQPGSMLNSLGTAEAVFLPLDRPVTDPAMGHQGYTQGAHVVPGCYYVFGGQYTSGASIAWIRDITAGSYERMLAQAKDVPPGSIGVCFLPHLRLANPPHDDPIARGAFIGLTADATAPTLVRSVVEGLAYETRNSLEGLIAFKGVEAPRKILVTGGSTRNRLLLDIKATVLGQPLQIAPNEEATTHGAAILGGIAAGLYRDIDHALELTATECTEVHPVPEWTDVYNATFREVYQPLYQTLRPINHAINRIEVDTSS